MSLVCRLWRASIDLISRVAVHFSGSLLSNADCIDKRAFLCGTTHSITGSTCHFPASFGYSFDPSHPNVASIGDLAGTQTVTRKATKVGSSTATYNASVSGLTGITVNVRPASHLDMYVYHGDTLVAGNGGGTSAQEGNW